MSRKTIELADFKPDVKMSLPRRIAQYLDWAAQKAPGRPVSYQMLTKVCEFTPRMPTEKDKRIDTVKRAVKRAKPVLMDEYGRGVVSHPGFGIRATIDSEDVARTQMEVDARRITSAVKAADRTRSLIKMSEIKDKELKARVGTVNSAIRVLVSPEVMGKLLTEKKDQ